MREVRLLDPQWHASYSARRVREFVRRCHEHGLAVTPQRLAIVRALLASENHPRAEDIYATVRRKQPHISWATVHRTLEQFCEVGEARKVTILHDSARYDGNVEPHHHVLCVRCRRIHDIEIPEVDKLLEGRTSLGQFALLRCSLEIDALCRRCQLVEKRMHAQRPRHTNLRHLNESEEKRQG
jgi:Fur family peroxide stress response transcriptional regulator